MDDFIQLDATVTLADAIKAVQIANEDLAPLTLTGGSGRGWSRYGALQRCALAFYNSFVQNPDRIGSSENFNLAVGGGVHACLAIYYMFGVKRAYEFWAAVKNHDIDPEIRNEIQRLFYAYADFYGDRDYIKPIIAELRNVHPETGDTCRYDLLATIDNPPLGVIAGTWIIEHKTAQRFDDATLDGWDIDGEVLGEAAFYKFANLAEKYGELRGVCINLIGKQKEPKFERVWVTPSQWQMEKHIEDLGYWRDYEYRLMQIGKYPRSLNNCIGRYGKCDYYESCRSR